MKRDAVGIVKKSRLKKCGTKIQILADIISFQGILIPTSMISKAKTSHIIVMTIKQRANFLGILVLYVLLLAGGLWHILGVLQWVMTIASPLMITALGVIPAWLYARTKTHDRERYRFVWWCIGVWIASTLYEWFGVQTGVIFGYYQYSTMLYPMLGGVTLIIGFAWLGMLLSSSAVVEKILGTKDMQSTWQRQCLYALLIGLVMTVFDGCMEYAVLRLGYWQWLDTNVERGLYQLWGVPLRNYVGWFCGGSVLAFIGLRYGGLHGRFPAWIAHSYTAQLAYFVMVYFK